MNFDKIKNSWILSSGLVGCENQCLGVIERLGIKTEIKMIKPSVTLSLMAPYGAIKDKVTDGLIIFISVLIPNRSITPRHWFSHPTKPEESIQLFLILSKFIFLIDYCNNLA